ncbi:MAG TPA: MFS transporter [Terriglobia bacterium]|nr:MFS transporter [Terriglobia bacterium]
MSNEDLTARPIKRLRWWIVSALFLSTAINYVDRQTLSVLSPVIIKEFNFTHEDYSNIVAAFQIAYAGMWLIGGVLMDVVGVRIGLALAMVWWSITGMMTGLANSLRQFEGLRFLMGMGEGCNWPGASKTVAEWFPGKERGLAVGIFDSGSSVGAIFAPPFVVFIATHFGWRFAFLTSGTLGFIWLFLWLALYRPLRTHPRLGAEERALIVSGQETAEISSERGAKKWLKLLGQSNTWGIVLGRSLTDPIWWFYVFWLPQYLSEARGFSLKQIGIFAWIPFLAADLGNLTGGYISGFLIKRGMAVVRARKWVCVVSSIPILAGIPAALTSNAYLALFFISIATWGYASWSTMGLTFPSDLFPRDVVASVTGLSGLVASGITGTLFTLAVGALVDKFHSYVPAFVAAGLVPLLATACVLVLIHAPKAERA